MSVNSTGRERMEHLIPELPEAAEAHESTNISRTTRNN